METGAAVRDSGNGVELMEVAFAAGESQRLSVQLRPNLHKIQALAVLSCNLARAERFFRQHSSIVFGIENTFFAGSTYCHMQKRICISPTTASAQIRHDALCRDGLSDPTGVP